MYRRNTRSLNTNRGAPLLSGSNRGSDIAAPNNTSLIVNRSKISEEPEDELPKSVTALLYEDDEDDTDTLHLARPSTSLLNSMSQKKQSTPQKKNDRILRESNSVVSSGRSASSSDVFMPERPLSRLFGDKQQKSVPKQKCFFLMTLSECGAEEISGDASFRLSEDQEVFARKLLGKLKPEETLEKFIKALREYLNNDEKLKKLVMFTQTSSDCDVARGPVQEPMLRLLLCVDCLQADLLQLLLEKMTAIIGRGKGVEDGHFITGMLRAVRCLPRVQNTKFCSKLFDLIKSAPTAVKKEIIILLPELIVDEELEEASNHLVNMFHGGSELTAVIINSLGTLPLSSSLRANVRDEVLAQLDKYSPAFLPNLVQFAISHCDAKDMPQVVMSLRENLPFTLALSETGSSVSEQRKAQNDSHTLKTFENLKNSLMVFKPLTDAWIKIIAGLTSPKSLKPVDLMVLILIHGNIFGRKSSTLTLLKNRIRCGVLLDSHIPEAFKVLGVVATENHTEVLALCSALLSSFEPSVAAIGEAMYLQVFTSCGSFLQQDVIRDLVMHLTTGSSFAVKRALTLLEQMREADHSAVEAHASSFMSALRVLPTLDLPLARQLADFVASLVITPSQQDSGLVEELHIFIRKQMAAWQQDVQRRGVVAAVMAVKHAALYPSDEDRFESNFLLKMAGGTSSACARKRGFFFDEVASMLRSVAARPAFLADWVDRVYSQALENVFASSLELECEYFPMSLQYSIENAGNLVFPVVAFIINPQPESYINATNVCAALRLLWCAEKDLGRISPMMCAAVILPDASVYDKFLSYQPSEQKMIMDCLFLCANFFIECVNALSKEKASEKLIIRLKQLMEVRKVIVQYVGQVPDYTPPECQFYVPVTKNVVKKSSGEGRKPGKGRGKKRKSDGMEVGNANQSHLDATALPCTSTAAPADAVAQLPTAVATTEDATDLIAFHGAFRELDCHAYQLLRMELKLNPSKVFKKKKMSDLIVADVSWSYRPEDKPELGPLDTLFLLQDYLVKADEILRERRWFLSKKPTGLANETITSTMFVRSSLKLLPKLCLKLDVVSRYCKDLLEANDGIWDAPGCFPKDSAEIKMCFCALLKIIADVVCWQGFQTPPEKAKLNVLLSILARKSSTSGTQAASSLALEAARFLAGLSDGVPLLSGGVSLTRAVQACIRHSGSTDFSLVGDLCGELLKRPWFTVTGATDRGVAYNQQLDSLVRMHLACAEDRLGAVQSVSDIAAEEVPALVGKEAPLPTYTALNRGNFPLMYRAVCEALVTAAADELNRKKEDHEACIAVWGIVTRSLMQMVEVAKAHSSRTNLAALLKRSQAIIQLFLSKGLPVMETALRVKSDEVLKVLKCLQAVTRFLHSVCCHSKMTNDAVVASHVPNTRALCERLTLEVKGMLLLNKIPLDLMPIAVLKNRDIQGNDIMSQSTVTTSDDESELPAEDDSDPTDVDADLQIVDDPTSD